MKRRPERDPMEKARELSQFMAAKTDPLGSWTGQPLDPYEVPVKAASFWGKRRSCREKQQRYLFEYCRKISKE